MLVCCHQFYQTWHNDVEVLPVVTGTVDCRVVAPGGILSVSAAVQLIVVAVEKSAASE